MRHLVAGIILGMGAYSAEPSKAPSDPRILSVFPSIVQANTPTTVVIRGASLTGSRSLLFVREGFEARVVEVKNEQAKDGPPVESVTVELTAASVLQGSYPFRIVAATGVSNELPLRVGPEAVLDESAVAVPLIAFPIVVAGRIANKGEVDSIWIEATAGETLTFQCAPGTAAFDPSLLLAEPSGSWFEAGRLNRIAFNDEPLHFPGLSNEARLVHRFEKGGKFAIQVRAFSGQGGPDATYALRITKGIGEPPLLHPPSGAGWENRRFTRKLPADWLGKLAERGGRTMEATEVRAVQAAANEAAEPPVMTAPGIIEGRIAKPADIHRVRLRLDAPKDLAIEVETPRATMPRFNPVVTLLAPDGSELVTNVYTKRNNNGLYMMKMIQAKSTFTLRAAGDYTIEIRDITTDVAGDDFVYRVLVRPQIPHIGKAEIAEDRVNLEPGHAKPLTVNLEREEEFKGLVLLSAEGLPEGVTATAGMANPVEKPPLPNAGRLERYVGKPQTTVLMLSAAESARPTEGPHSVRVYLRTVSNGVQSAPIFIKEIPVMVIPRRPS